MAVLRACACLCIAVMLFSVLCLVAGRPVRARLRVFQYNPNNTDLIEGDIMPPKQSKRRFTTYAVVRDRTLTWPDGTVFYEYDPDSFPSSEDDDENGDDSERKIIVEAMELIQKKTCVKFEPRTNQENYVTFAHRPGRCASHVGMQGGEQVVALDLSYCGELGQVAHELLHALGFFHEHSRPDRDEYVEVLWKNINPDANQSFWLKPETEADALGEPYDYESVMHYPHDAFTLNAEGPEPTLLPKSPDVKRETLGKGYAKNFLTETDIRKINVLYTCDANQSFWLKPETEADTLGEPYDYESVMHYPYDAFAIEVQQPTLLPKSPEVKRETLGKAYMEGFLTETDVKQINVLYTCGKQPS